jgi:hypothetical protein
MGQKANPISLRLNINRNFDSCWYSDTDLAYSKLLGKELQLRNYISSLFSSLGPTIYKGRVSFQFYQKKLIIYYFFADIKTENTLSSTRKNRVFPSTSYTAALPSRYREKEVEVGSNSKKAKQNGINSSFSGGLDKAKLDNLNWDFSPLASKTNFLKKRIILLFLKYLLEKNSNESFYFFPNLSQFIKKDSFSFIFSFTNYKNYFELIFIYHFLKKQFFLPTGEAFSSTKNELASNSLFFQKIQKLANQKENHLKRKTVSTNLSFSTFEISKNLSFFPIKFNSKYTSAHFLSHYIAKCFEKKLSTREIFRTIQKEIILNKNLLGLRIQCAGRIGGVEMAKVESRKFGQTSFHTFNTKLDFAIAEAYTQYGIIGIQVSVWGY